MLHKSMKRSTDWIGILLQNLIKVFPIVSLCVHVHIVLLLCIWIHKIVISTSCRWDFGFLRFGSFCTLCVAFLSFSSFWFVLLFVLHLLHSNQFKWKCLQNSKVCAKLYSMLECIARVLFIDPLSLSVFFRSISMCCASPSSFNHTHNQIRPKFIPFERYILYNTRIASVFVLISAFQCY